VSVCPFCLPGLHEIIDLACLSWLANYVILTMQAALSVARACKNNTLRVSGE
jgi:hypothetical protein